MRAHENPFRTARIGSLAFRHPTLTVPEIAARWRALGRRAAIVGPHGSGKTTLLRELGARLAGEGFRLRHWFLGARRPLPTASSLVREARRLGAGDVLLFDGAGHLPRLVWWRVARACRGAGGLLVTAHAAGRLPTLLETGMTPRLAAALTRELAGADADALEPVLRELYDRHAGNLHEIFLALYDRGARDA